MKRAVTLGLSLIAAQAVACAKPPALSPKPEYEGVVMLVNVSPPHHEDAKCNARSFNATWTSARELMQLLSKAGLSVTTDPNAPHDATASFSGVFFCATFGGDRFTTATLQVQGGAVATVSGGDVSNADLQQLAYDIVNAPQTIALGKKKHAATTPPAAVAAAAPPPAPVALALPPAPAPAPAPAPVPVAAPIASVPKPASAEPQRTAYALVIGIERYRDLPSPAGARADAQGFADVLRKTLGIPESQLRLALDDRATRTDIERHVAWLKTNAAPGSRIYFFFSGHGAPDAAKGTPYIVPYDGDPQAVALTGMPMSDVLKGLSESKAKDVIAFADTCFSGAGGRSVLPKGARPLVRVLEPRGEANIALFSSSSGAEISGPSQDGAHGAFTKYLLEGFGAAKADADGDGQITLQELADWVGPRVTRDAKAQERDQTPKLTVGPKFQAPRDYPLAWGIKP